jgi:hypothetical protein
MDRKTIILPKLSLGLTIVGRISIFVKSVWHPMEIDMPECLPSLT